MTVHNNHHVSGLHTDTHVHTKKKHGHREIVSVTVKVTGSALGSHGWISVTAKNHRHEASVDGDVSNRVPDHVRSAAIMKAVRKIEHKMGWRIDRDRIDYNDLG